MANMLDEMMLTESEKEELTKEYQERFKPILDNLSSIMADVVVQNDPVGLLFIIESIAVLTTAYSEHFVARQPKEQAVSLN